MATNFPTSVDVLTNPVSNDSLNSPSHSAQHANANDAIEAVEAYLLTGAGAAGLVKLIPTGATNGTVAANGDVTIGSAVSSVNVTGAFSSAYDVYKIIISGGVASGAPDLQLSLDGITTGYYSTLTYQSFGSTTVIGAQASNAARWSWTGAGTTSSLNMNLELHSPNLAKPKTASNFYNEMGISATNGLSRQFNASTTQATGFTITPSTGTITGGIIHVYGYK